MPGPVPPTLLLWLAVTDEGLSLELSLQAATVASSAHSATRVKILCPITKCPHRDGRYNAEDSHHVHAAERASPEVIARFRKAVLAARLPYRHGPDQLATAMRSSAVPYVLASRPTSGAGIKPYISTATQNRVRILRLKTGCG